MPDKDKDKDVQKDVHDGQQPNVNDDDGRSTTDAVKKGIDDIKKQAASTNDPEVLKILLDKITSLEERLLELQRQEAERKEREEQEILKRMSETERLRYELEKKEKEIEKVKKELEESLGKKARELEERLKKYEEDRKKLAEAAARAKALEAASRFGAYNPEQVYLLIKDNLVAGEDGSVFVRVRDGEQFKQVPVDEYLKEFLARPENKNLLKTNAAIGDRDIRPEEGVKTSAPSAEGLTPEVEKFWRGLSERQKENIMNKAMIMKRPWQELAHLEYIKYTKAKQYKEKYMKRS